MIVRTRGGGHREYRANNPLAQDYIPTPAQFGTWLASATGEHITVDKAASIPAVLDAIFTISEAIATLPFRVYQGIGADKQPAMTHGNGGSCTTRPTPSNRRLISGMTSPRASKRTATHTS
jgi:phage portal protein BeeE